MDKSGVLLLNKKGDISSNKIINKIKYELNKKEIWVKKIGHAGTLDPGAEGVLVVLINGATKLSDYLLFKDKEYIAEIEIGRSYDTFDIYGSLEEERKIDLNDLKYIKDNIDKTLKDLTGTIRQVPPIYSSLKLNGKKLYEMARNGEKVDLESKARVVTIYSIDRLNEPFLTPFDTVRFSIKCHVSKGTYIRSLAVDIGKLLNMPSCMSKLTRVKSGEFNIKDSYTFDDIIVGKYQLLNMLDCIKNIKKIEADKKLYFDCINGKKIYLEEKDEMVAISYENKLVAIYEKDKNINEYKAKTVWN